MRRGQDKNRSGGGKGAQLTAHIFTYKANHLRRRCCEIGKVTWGHVQNALQNAKHAEGELSKRLGPL